MITRRKPRFHVVRGGVAAAFATSVALAAVGVAQLIPAQAISRLPTPTLTISTAVPTAVCPGPQSLAIPDGAKPVSIPGPVEVNAVSSTAATIGDLVPPAAGGAPEVANPKPLNGFGNVWLGSSSPNQAGAVRLDADQPKDGGAVTAATAGLQTSFGVSGDLRGVDAIGCAPATASAWLVGGATTDGDRLKLLLANPTATPAIADIAVHDGAGQVEAAGSEGVVVPAGKQVAVLIDAFAPGREAVAVEVNTRSGRVVAHLQHHRLRGFTPGGVDNVVPAAAANGTQVLPGLVLSPPGTAAVRVVVPGTVDAVVRVAIIGVNGQVQFAGGVVNVAAGAVRDVPLTGIPTGVYSAVITADVPVVAAGISSVTLPGGEIAGTPAALGKNVPPSELAWTSAAEPLRGLTALALPKASMAGRPSLINSLVFATTDTSARVRLREVSTTGVIGLERTVEIPADRTLSLPLAATVAGVLIQGPGEPGTGGPLFAALVVQAKDDAGPMITAVAVRPGLETGERTPRVVYDQGIGVPGAVR